MNSLRKVTDVFTGMIAGAGLGGEALRETIQEMDTLHNNLELARQQVKEQANLAQIELGLEDREWVDLQNSAGTWDFKRDAVKEAVALSRVMYLINPLIHRAVTLQELYVWGSGVNIEAEDKVADGVLESFFKDVKNQRVVGDSWPEREREQRIDGNTFLVFFRNKSTGAARVRLLPLDDVADIIYNPDDCKEPWYYLTREKTDDKGNKTPAKMYPDIDYRPSSQPKTYQGKPVQWDNPVLHIYTGGLSTMRFGLPELYSAFAWARSYKRFLENFAKIIEAYGRMAMKVSNLSGKKGVAAAKSKLHTNITSGSMKDTNPPPQTASWMMLQGGVDVAPIKTAGSTTAPDEARALRCMVAAGADMPEHFFGDSDVGNFATSTTLDRPTELKMIQRQAMWATVIMRICNKLMEWSAQAPKGVLRQAGYKLETVRDSFDDSRTVIITPPANGSIKVTVKFPSIVTRDVTDRVRAVVMATTLGGHSAEGIIPDRKLVFRLLMEALGEKEAQFLMDKYYPDAVIQGFIDPAEIAKNDRMEAEGKVNLGKAALKQADNSEIMAKKPAPTPVAAGGNK